MIKPITLALLAGGALVAADSAWTAVLHPQNNSTVEGTADVKATTDSTMLMTVDIRNTTAGTTYTAVLYNGTCASPGGMVDEGTVYKKVVGDSTAVARSETALRIKTLTPDAHLIQVHAQTDEQKTETTPLGPVVACGDLKVVR